MLGISLKTLYNRLAAYKEEGSGRGGRARDEEEFEERDAA
jgi:hypothetical protein